MDDDDVYPDLTIYISELILDSYQYIPVAYVTLDCVDWTLIRVAVAGFVGTGGYLIRYYILDLNYIRY